MFQEEEEFVRKELSFQKEKLSHAKLTEVWMVCSAVIFELSIKP